MENDFRKGVIVKPVERIDEKQIEYIDEASMSILENPGILCFSEKAAEIYEKAGCRVEMENEDQNSRRVSIPANVVKEALRSVPTEVILGARNPANRLKLDAREPHIHFGTGSETNIFQMMEPATFVKKDDPSVEINYPYYREERGSVNHLCQSAKLCNALENVDFFIRNVNIQDEEIDFDNKDANVFLAALMYMTKHVQAGVVNLDKLDDIIKMGEIIAGGEEEFRNNPVLSFITCVIKSPLQMVEDTTEKLIEIAKRGLPTVISSSPQGGSTAPIREEGIVSLINAEILAGITLTQLVNPGTPVLYGAVPVRARLDNLHDLYGAPEFIHYNMNAVIMARHYGIPCYSSAGVGDSKVPGVQATVEKLFAQLSVASAGAQYIHYAFGLLDKTNIFSPLQAVLDNEHVGIIKNILTQAGFDSDQAKDAVEEIRKVSGSQTKLFAKYIRKARRLGFVSEPYRFETKEYKDEVLEKANERVNEIFNGDDEKLDESTIDEIYRSIPGLLPREKFEV